MYHQVLKNPKKYEKTVLFSSFGVNLTKLFFFENAKFFRFSFVTYEKNVFSIKWPSLTAKIGKQKKAMIGRIDSWSVFTLGCATILFLPN